MAQTSREIVRRCLTFENPERMPRDMWILPWAGIHFPDEVKKLQERFPSDFGGPEYFYPPSSRVKGDAYKIGEFTDEWGCTFVNLQEGIIGEVEKPLIENISDWKLVQPPYEQIPKGVEIEKAYDVINRSCAKSDKFLSAGTCPRPWERYQFIRGTINAMMDVMMPEEGCRDLLKVIHDFYMTELEFWVKTDVDAISFMDDWGSQNQLLIPPRVWRELFKPMYKDFCDLAHAHDKFVFMHSDGYITEIYEDLIEVGVSAINSQLFCMDMAELEKIAKGKITFWGEIDRQHVLPDKNSQAGRDAVRKVASHLYDPSGGMIVQLEFGAGAKPETVYAVYDEWEKVELEWKK